MRSLATNILLDATNNLIKQIVFEKKQYSHKMLGLACLDAVENQLVSILWNHKYSNRLSAFKETLIFCGLWDIKKEKWMCVFRSFE